MLSSRDTAMVLYTRQAEEMQRLRRQHREQAAVNLVQHASRHNWSEEDLAMVADALGVSDLLPLAPQPHLKPAPKKRSRKA